MRKKFKSIAVCTVIPPYILERIARSSEGRAREVAEETLAQTNELAPARQVPFHNIRPSPPKAVKRRNVYDARRREVLPGVLVLSEHARRRGKRDVEVNEAYDGSGATYDFFARAYGRNSIDDRGQRLDSTVHYGRAFDNALWNGRQMIYGDGDGKLFVRFTAAVDVIGHELMSRSIGPHVAPHQPISRDPAGHISRPIGRHVAPHRPTSRDPAAHMLRRIARYHATQPPTSCDRSAHISRPIHRYFATDRSM